MMDSSGFSLPRPDCFPAGLRVLVVDDDPTWLKILEKMLKKCNYEAREALDLLRERKGGYDIVISDVNMPDMDGFKLLEHVGLKMDLPVIMMSVDGETSRVMKGVQHGVCDYLLKPIRMKELRNIWQHVFRKRIQEVRDIEGHEEIQMMRDDGYFFCAGVVPGNKRKELDNRNDGDPSSSKKARVVWTVDLHQKFVNAVNLIGLEKVGPKKILDLMGVPWLTRENVASHLQKYRLYLSRLQKENDTKASLVGSKQSEFSPKENVHSKVPVPGDDSKIFEGNIKNEMNDLAKSSSSSISFDSHPFGPLNSDAVFKHEKKPAFCVEKKFDHLPLPIEVDSGKPMHGGIVPWHSTSTRSQHSEKVMKVESTAALFSIQPESHLTSQHTVDQVPCSIWREKSQSLEQNDPGSGHRNTLIGTGSALWDTYFSEYSPQTDVHIQNPYLGTVDPLSFNNQDFITDVPSYLYDALKFNREFHVEPVEYPVVGQGVYIS